MAHHGRGDGSTQTLDLGTKLCVFFSECFVARTRSFEIVSMGHRRSQPHTITSVHEAVRAAPSCGYKTSFVTLPSFLTLKL